MRAGDPQSIGRHAVEGALARLRAPSGSTSNTSAASGCGTCTAARCTTSPQISTLVVAGMDEPSGVAGRVARAADCANAGQRLAVAHGAHALAIGRGGVAPCRCCGGCARSRRCGVAVEPERGFLFVHDQLGVRKDGLPAASTRPSAWSGMDVRQQHIVDGFRRNAKRAQIVGHLPKFRSHGRAAAGIDQRPLAAKLEQIAVHRQEQRVRAADQPLASARRKVDAGIERSRKRAVAQRGDVDVADLSPHPDALPSTDTIE